MIRGPAEYVPSVEVEVITKRTAIPLDENEGIYVRDIKTGKVRAVTGETYMLNQDEELWSKVYFLISTSFLFALYKICFGTSRILCGQLLLSHSYVYAG